MNINFETLEIQTNFLIGNIRAFHKNSVYYSKHNCFFLFYFHTQFLVSKNTTKKKYSFLLFKVEKKIIANFPLS